MSGFSVPTDVGVLVDGDADPVDSRVYLARLADGPICVLSGLAVVIWRAALTDADPVATTAAILGVAEAEVRPAAEDFLAEAVTAGLLVRSSQDRVNTTFSA